MTKQEEIYYAETLKNWFASRMERDKSLITLSWGGVAAVIAMLVTAKALPIVAWFFALLSLTAFALTVVLILIIFRGNSDALGEILQPSHPEQAQRVERRLRIQDRVALVAFVTGIVSASIAGLVAASIK